ncbi:MAG TPA: hypothetical protein GXX75_25845 [Clostridiales bacterium]|nr:hypothetical protein [Clostridiales bacterium]
MKTNQLSEATKVMLLAAAVLITCTIVWLGFQATGMAREISSSAMGQMREVADDIKDSGISKYDGLTVDGSEVVNCIRRNLGGYESTEAAPIYITVTTALSTNTYTNNAYIKDIKSFADTKYIRPLGRFLGDVIKNENGVIEGIVFVRQ